MSQIIRILPGKVRLTSLRINIRISNIIQSLVEDRKMASHPMKEVIRV
jgi:hypothetical protein